MAAGKIYHTLIDATVESISGVTYVYYPRDDLMKGSLFSPAIGDIIIYDGTENYVGRHNNASGRTYYSVVG